MSEWCNTPGVQWELLFGAIILGAVGSVVIGWLRQRQLRLWDLRDSPVAPSTAAHLWTLGICTVAFGMVISYAVYATEECAPIQQSANVRYWWGGIVIGVVCCLFSLVNANRSYERGR